MSDKNQLQTQTLRSSNRLLPRLEQTIPANLLRLHRLSYHYNDLLENKPIENQSIRMAPDQFVCLRASGGPPPG